jgi:hypothetical protein
MDQSFSQIKIADLDFQIAQSQLIQSNTQIAN